MKLAPKQIAQAGAATGNPLLWSGSRYAPAPNVAMALSGLDGSQTVGAAQIDAPSGISTIAAGATTCVVTNSLATAYCKVTLEWYGDHGATRSWVVRANGSFTVTLSSAASANTSFGWTVSGMTSSMLSGLIHYWSLDGNSNDAFTTGNGTDTAVTYTTPKLGSACGAFNGTTSKIVTTVNGPTGAAPWSVSMWYKQTTTSSLGRLISWGTTPIPGAVFLEISIDTLRVSIGTAYGAQKASSVDVWHHAVATYDGTTSRLYLDNSAPSEVALACATLAGPILLGNASVYYHQGLIDDTCMWDRALTAGEVASLYNSGAGLETMSGSLLTGLIHQWHLNGSSVDNVGTAHGTDTAVTYGGKSGQCAMFNGTTSKVVTAVNGPLGAAPWSVSMWVYFTANYNYMDVISWGTGSNGTTASLERNASGFLDITNYAVNGPGVTVAAGAWHHIVAKYDGTTATIYLDNGAPVSGAMTFNVGTGPITIGRGPALYYTQGLIDEPAMWNRALTAAEVTALYNAGAGRYYPAFV